jgi:hypothetical protein
MEEYEFRYIGSSAEGFDGELYAEKDYEWKRRNRSKKMHNNDVVKEKEIFINAHEQISFSYEVLKTIAERHPKVWLFLCCTFKKFGEANLMEQERLRVANLFTRKETISCEDGSEVTELRLPNGKLHSTHEFSVQKRYGKELENSIHSWYEFGSKQNSKEGGPHEIKIEEGNKVESWISTHATNSGEKPLVITTREDGVVVHEYMRGGRHHRSKGRPAIVEFRDGECYKKVVLENGNLVTRDLVVAISYFQANKKRPFIECYGIVFPDKRGRASFTRRNAKEETVLKMWFSGGRLHRSGAPSALVFNRRTNIKCTFFFLYGKLKGEACVCNCKGKSKCLDFIVLNLKLVLTQEQVGSHSFEQFKKQTLD